MCTVTRQLTGFFPCGGELVDRSDCPWDDETRRPSHADRRSFLRRAIVAKELEDASHGSAMPAKIMLTLEKLLRLATLIMESTVFSTRQFFYLGTLLLCQA